MVDTEFIKKAKQLEQLIGGADAAIRSAMKKAAVKELDDELQLVQILLGLELRYSKVICEKLKPKTSLDQFTAWSKGNMAAELKGIGEATARAIANSASSTPTLEQRMDTAFVDDILLSVFKTKVNPTKKEMPEFNRLLNAKYLPNLDLATGETKLKLNPNYVPGS